MNIDLQLIDIHGIGLDKTFFINILRSIEKTSKYTTEDGWIKVSFPDIGRITQFNYSKQHELFQSLENLGVIKTVVKREKGKTNNSKYFLFTEEYQNKLLFWQDEFRENILLKDLEEVFGQED